MKPEDESQKAQDANEKGTNTEKLEEEKQETAAKQQGDAQIRAIGRKR